MNRKQRRAEKRQEKALSAEIEQRLGEAARLRAASRFQEAADIYQAILQSAPDHPETLHQFGVMAIMAGEPTLAADVIGRAVVKAGSRGEGYLSDLAYALALSGRYDEALDAYGKYCRARPNDADAHYNMGNVLNALARRDEAAAAYRRAVELTPDFADAHANLGGILHLSRKYEEAVEAYRRALDILPDSADLHHNLGAAYRALGRLDAAAAAYQQAAARAPERAAFQEKLGATLNALGRFDDAIPPLQRALATAPDFVDARMGLAEALIGTGAPADAVAECDKHLHAYGYNSGIIACKAIAHNECGEADAARYFLDFDRFVRPVEIAAPADYADLAAFNAAIEAAARADPSFAFEPPAVATTSGYQTGDLFGAPAPVIAALGGAIDRAVRDYIAALPDEPAHPFVANAPARWSLNGWTVILQAQGHQRAHIHPDGWLSGVYYVKLPASIGAQSRQGWIEFGRPPDTVACRREMASRTIEPRVGRMLLFPSYVYHRTIPFEDTENRISFAFDVMPAA